MKPTITVKHAGATKPGFARIELLVARAPDADWLTKHGESRALTAAAYCVAARLEQISGAERLEFEVSVAKARHGILDIDTRNDGIDGDVITEIVIEACTDCGFWLDDSECGDGPFGCEKVGK